MFHQSDFLTGLSCDTIIQVKELEWKGQKGSTVFCTCILSIGHDHDDEFEKHKATRNSCKISKDLIYAVWVSLNYLFQSSSRHCRSIDMWANVLYCQFQHHFDMKAAKLW